ncbi:MAG: site-specific integrase [Prevotellaceae bacterium]|jgi:integrase|nr:site-specific integrase [Prevotellaceae bacterium]
MKFTPDTLTSSGVLINEKMNIFKKKAAKKMTDFVYEYLSKCRRGKEYKYHYQNIGRHVENFVKHSGVEVYTNSFTEQLAEEFIAYLRSKELLANTVKSICRRVTTLLNKAERAGYPIQRGFENISLKEEDSCAIYLTIDELKKLNELQKLSKKAAVTRDRFLVGCFTALRVSDYGRLTVKDNFINDFIQIKTQKTGVVVTIPTHPVIRDVLKRNNGELPPMPSLQTFNKTIKRVCKKANITDVTLWERTVGTKVVRKKMNKWQLVASHTARRTGATLMYLAGIPTARIMLLTGHQTEQAFFRYIRIAREENAKILSEHSFFTNF